MAGLHYNLFHFAPRELSHSAFWAWVLQCTDSEDPLLSAPKAVGLALLDATNTPRPLSEVKVETEVKLRKAGRLDVVVTVDEGRATLVIENKVLSKPAVEQLDRYEEELRADARGGLSLAVMSTAFDEDVRDEIRSRADWQYLGIDTLCSILEPHQHGHALLQHYASWLAARKRKREELARYALSADRDKRNEALGTAEGQWALMKALLPVRGRQDRGTNVDGSPWTQFCFVEPVGERDMLFYRIDQSSAGPYFSLRQYQGDPIPTPQAKLARREELRGYWADACRACGDDLRLARPRNRGIMESEIGLLLIDENPPEVLLRAIPKVHAYLLDRLAENGWAVQR